MNQPRPFLLCSTLLAALLVGCGDGSDDPPPTSAVPAVAEGAFAASVQGDTAGVGLALFDAAGQGFVLLSDDGDSGHTVMHVADRTQARRAPVGPGFVTLAFARSEPVTLSIPGGAELAGEYQVLLDGKPVSLSITADGRIGPAGTGACKLGGQVDLARSIGGARALSLTLENCGSLAAGSYQGVLFASADTAPARWQAVVENGRSVIDLLAYR